MRQEMIVTGKDIPEAIANARALLLKDTPEAELRYEILETGSRGIFGIIGVKPAKIKAYIADEADDEANEDAPRSKKAGGEARNNDRVRRNRNRNRRRNASGRNDDRAPADFTPDKTAPKANTAKKPVIPEAELKMEKIEIAAGEDLSVDFISRTIGNLGLDVSVELYRCEDETRRIVLSGADAGVLIGHHGETLDALQYLANLACAKKNANGERDHSRVTLDIEGYRAKREETLRGLARAKAAKALRTGRNIMLEPMNAYERRIIHSEVQSIEGVSTSSIGSDNARKVVIYLTNEKTLPEKDETVANDAPEAEETINTVNEATTDEVEEDGALS